MIRVSRFTSVQDVGRILNEKTARSQIIGGVVYGLGQALMESTEYDDRRANPVTRTLGDYHVPVNLDAPLIDVHFIGKPIRTFRPSAHAASAKSALPVSPPQSPTRFTTRPESASGTCR